MLFENEVKPEDKILGDAKKLYGVLSRAPETVIQQTWHAGDKELIANAQASITAMLQEEDEGKVADRYVVNKDMVRSPEGYRALIDEVKAETYSTFANTLDQSLDSALKQGDVNEASNVHAQKTELQGTLEYAYPSDDEMTATKMLVDQAPVQSEQARQVELDMRIITKLQETLSDDRSLGDKAVDIANLIIFSDAGLDWRDLMDQLSISNIDPATFLKRWHAMNIEDKEALLPVILDKLGESFSDAGIRNAYKEANALAALLDPGMQKDIQREMLIDDISLGIDASVLLAGIVKVMKAMRVSAASSNSVKIAKKVQKNAVADRANATAVASKEASESMNLTQEMAHINAMPDDAHKIFVEATEGVSRGTHRILTNKELAETPIGQRMAQLRDPNFTFKDGILDIREREAALRRFDEAFKAKQEAYLDQGLMYIDDVKRTHVDDDGFIFEFKIRDQATGKLVSEQNQKVFFTVNDVGSFEGKMESGAVSRAIASPMQVLRNVSDAEEVESATRVLLAQHRYRAAFNDMLDTILKPLGKGLTPMSRKGLKELDDVLLRGDDFVNPDGSIGKVFTMDELRAGIRRADDSIVYLKPKQIQAYYEVNELSKYFWMLRNEELRKTLKINGFKNARINGQDIVAHAYDMEADARKALRNIDVRKAYDEMTNQLIDLDVEGVDVLGNIYRSDRVMVRAQKPMRLPDGTYADYAIVSKSKVGDVPAQVLHYKAGYVPRIYEDGLYFVKSEARGTRNGVPDKLLHEKTERVFRRRTDAEAWAAEQLGKNPNLKLHVRHDRELSLGDLDDEAIGFSGGLYTSPRSTSPLVFEDAGEAMPRMGALESMMRNAQSLSNYLPRNTWRIGMQKRWLNTAKKMGAIDEDVTDFFNAPLKLKKGSKEYDALEASRDYIKDQMQIPSLSEEYLHTKFRDLAEMIERQTWLPGNEPIRKFVNKFSTQDPFQYARSATFHTLLGWFNPVQLFVQAQGASIAWSLRPTSFFQGSFRKGLAIRALAYKHKIGKFADPATRMADTKAWASKVGMDAEELTEMMEVWHKSGLYESITATADHAASVQNFSFGWKAVRDAADKGLVAYREGELFTRATAFTTAWDEMRTIKGIKKGKLNLNFDEQKKLMDMAMSYQMNLTRANRAAWQKGALSIPTQFLQIQAKWIEEVLGKQLTTVQKMKFMGMQAAIYGAAGVPFADVVVDSITRMAGTKPEDIDPVAQRYLAGGIMEAMSYGLAGADIEFGSRGAILSNLDEFTRDLIYGTPDPMWKYAFGAFGGVTSRANDAWNHLKPLATLGWEEGWGTDEMKFALNEIGSIVSTWNNAQKAWFLYSQRAAFSRNGAIIADELTAPDMFNISTIIAQAIGFQPKTIPDMYDLAALNRFKEDQIKGRVDLLMHFHHKYLANYNDPQIARKNMEYIQGVILHDLNDFDKYTVLERAGKRIAEPRTRLERELRKYYRNTVETGFNASIFARQPSVISVIPNAQDPNEPYNLQGWSTSPPEELEKGDTE